MTRWAAGLEYLGTRYRGWQAQEGDIASLQREFEAALSQVADHPVAVSVAGRTDAGVHALQQVIHFDSPATRTAYSWVLGSNRCLPPDLSLRWVQPVPVGFHARHSALYRRYRYLIHNHRARSALAAGRAAWHPRELDAAAMHRAAQALLGERDFSAYRASECQSPTPMRNVHFITVWRGGQFVAIDIQANAFLHHMVRNIAGVLMEIGAGRQPEDWTAALLAGRDRRLGPATAPAEGLYFVAAGYPPEFALPAAPEPWFPASTPAT
jgi:tRNA pseudouridine38-40 synthase